MSVFNKDHAAGMLGTVLIATAIYMLPSVAVSIYYNEIRPGVSFFCTMLVCLLAGLWLRSRVSPNKRRLKTRDGFLIITLCWVLASVVGSIPLFVSGAIPNVLDAFFESCSGFTTTGATLINDVESTPRSVLMWRSCTVFMGGSGIILFTAFLRDFTGYGDQKISRRETPVISYQTGGVKNKAPFYYLFSVYITLTVVLVLLFLFRGMSVYDAFIHALSLAGTGGFSSYNNGLAHFQDPILHFIVIIAMVITGANINVLRSIFRRGLRQTFRSTELRVYFAVILLATSLVAADLTIQGDYLRLHHHGIAQAVMDAAFQVTSILSTTGQYLTNFNNWPTFSRMILLALMMTGACSASLGGGPKLHRIIVSVKFIRRGLLLKVHPNRVSVLTLNKAELSQETATNITNHMFLYILTVFVGSLLISIDNFDIMTTFSATLSCINNNGLFFGLSGHGMNFSAFSWFSKMVFSVLMIAGRLELFTVIMLFSKHYWNPDKA